MTCECSTYKASKLKPQPRGSSSSCGGPGNLPRWARAFTSAGNGRARLETPAGGVDIALDVSADAEAGTVDWRLEFPDGAVGVAQSRVTETTRGTCIYSFVLHAPPVALEQIEGALETQSRTCDRSSPP